MSSEKLREEWVRLQRAYTASSEVWNDSVARRFEREFWSEFERDVPEIIERVAEGEGVISSALAESDFESEE